MQSVVVADVDAISVHCALPFLHPRNSAHSALEAHKGAMALRREMDHLISALVSKTAP